MSFKSIKRVKGREVRGSPLTFHIPQPDQTGYYSSIVIDDLEEGRQADRVLLNMQEQQRYFEGRAGRAADQSTGPKSDEVCLDVNVV